MASIDATTRVPEKRVSELLALVRERNPFQHRRLEKVGAEPRLADLPPLTKRELVEDQVRHPPFGTNLTYPLERYTQLHQTSGTTGPPLRVLDTAEDWAWWRGRFAHMLRTAGVGPADRVGLAYSFGPHVQFWAAIEGLHEVGAMAVPLGGMTSVQRLQTVADVGATAAIKGPAACTVKPFVRLTTSLPVITVTVRGPVGAESVILTCTSRQVSHDTVTLPTVIPGPMST